jgi:hypothetical protein
MRASDRFRVGSTTKTFALRGRPAARRRGEARARRQRRALAARARPQWRRHHRPPSAQPHERAADYAPGEDETFISRVLAGRRKTWEPRELVAIGTAHPPLNPGAQWSYSNAGYILIVQAASGKPLEAELRARILASPRLRATSLDTDPRITGRHAHGYSHFARGGASPSASRTSRGPGRPPRSSRPRTSSRASVALLRWPPRRGMIARPRGRASSTARRCSPMRSSMATEPNAGNRCATSSSPGSKQAACATPQERCPQDRVRRARGSRPRCPPPRRSQDRVDTRSALQGVITRVPGRGRWNRCHLARSILRRQDRTSTRHETTKAPPGSGAFGQAMVVGVSAVTRSARNRARRWGARAARERRGS